MMKAWLEIGTVTFNAYEVVSIEEYGPDGSHTVIAFSNGRVATVAEPRASVQARIDKATAISRVLQAVMTPETVAAIATAARMLKG